MSAPVDRVLRVPSIKGVLVNDTDVDRLDELQARAYSGPTARGGFVTLRVDGSFEYDPTISDELRQEAMASNLAPTGLSTPSLTTKAVQ